MEIRGKLACMRLQATRQWYIKPGVYSCAIYTIFQSLDVTFFINSLPWSFMTVVQTPNGIMCLTSAYETVTAPLLLIGKAKIYLLNISTLVKM